MTRRLRAALLAVALLCTPGVARAEDPTVLVAARHGGDLVRVTLRGRVATVEVLVRGGQGVYYVPTQAHGASVSFVRLVETEGESDVDVGTLNATTGAHRLLTGDHRSGHLLVSRDGRYRYILKSTAYDTLQSMVRTDSRGGRPVTLVRAVRNVRLSRPALSPDGRTLYVARTPNDGRSTLVAVDTRTGAQRVVTIPASFQHVVNVAVSPDGRTLAVSYLDGNDASHVALLTLANGSTREFQRYGWMNATAFTPDGSGVLLTATGPYYDPFVLKTPELSIGDVATGAVTPLPGSGEIYDAFPVA